MRNYDKEMAKKLDFPTISNLDKSEDDLLRMDDNCTSSLLELDEEDHGKTNPFEMANELKN